MVVRKDTTLCAGTWELPGADDTRIQVVADGVKLSCRPGTVLDGVTNRGVGVGNRRSGRRGGGADGVTVRGCTFRRFDRGIEIVPGSRNAVIEGNTLTDIRGVDGSGIAVLVGGTGLTVRNNRIADAGHGGVIALGLRFGVIADNQIVNSKCSITLRDGSSFNRVTGNRLVNASEWGTALGMAGKDGAFTEHNSLVGNDYRTDAASPGRMRVGIMLLDHSRYTAIVGNAMTDIAVAGIASAQEKN
jgi:nitrous oxidase accessory protein NosD